MLVKQRRGAGFSMIELAIAMTIVCILLVLGAPTLSGYLQNSRLGTMAQSMYGGLQTARTEAVRLNQNVQFVLTNSALDAVNTNTVTLDSTGKNWMIRYQSSASAAFNNPPLEQKSSNTNDVGGVQVAASAPVFEFNGLGNLTTGTAIGISLTNPVMGTCSPGPVRCWNVVVAPGGQVRLCSPDGSLTAGDTRAC